MNEAIISVIFRIINFGIICGIAVYFSKKKLIPQAKEKIAAKYAALKEMVSQNKSLLSQQKDLEREINEQELLSKKLYDQIKIWSLSFEQQQKEFEERRKFLAQQVVERLRSQAERKIKKSMNDSVLSKALEGAQRELASFFSSEKEGRVFTATVVDLMRKDRT